MAKTVKTPAAKKPAEIKEVSGGAAAMMQNKAKAAFVEHKKRLEQTNAGAAGIPGKEPPFQGRREPVAPPYQGIPWPYPGPPPVTPFAPVPQGSLTSSIGTMLRLGVDAINAGLNGWLRIMEGMQGDGYVDRYACSCRNQCNCDPCHGQPHYTEGCWQSCGCSCCCNPGVYGC